LVGQLSSQMFVQLVVTFHSVKASCLNIK